MTSTGTSTLLQAGRRPDWGSTTPGRAVVTLGLIVAWIGWATPTAAGGPPAAPARDASGRSWHLLALQDAAIQADPRSGELQLLTEQSRLRRRNIEVLRLPSATVAGQAQYQSNVATAPIVLPNGLPILQLSRATYDSSVRVDQRILDPTRSPDLAVADAQLAQDQARVRAALFTLRQAVNDAFFAALGLQERSAALVATIADLDARLREIRLRVREGTALAADAAAVEATLLERRQDQEELQANRRAALLQLARLTGQTIADGDQLIVPDLATAVVEARKGLEQTRARPEYAAFARARDLLGRQEQSAVAQERPAVSLFGRVGYGRPGLNFLSGQAEMYGLAAVQVQWKAWTWNVARREHAALDLQQRIVSAEEAAFTKEIGEATEGDLATIDRLQSALTIDDRIIALRHEVDRVTRLRFDQGVVTASEWLDRSTDLLHAQFNRAGHQVDLAQASARLLTTLGLDVRE